jgi:hypothetical protein
MIEFLLLVCVGGSDIFHQVCSVRPIEDRQSVCAAEAFALKRDDIRATMIFKVTPEAPYKEVWCKTLAVKPPEPIYDVVDDPLAGR